MNHPTTILSAVRLALALGLFGTSAASAASASKLRRSVVKIYATAQRPDYSMPWQWSRPQSGTGSGFIIRKRRILTNAHVVSDARFIEVQLDGNPRRFPATVAAAGHDCDLAILDVADDRFFEDTDPVKISSLIPRLNEPVTVLGYPMGGTRVSLTRGVVSRIDFSAYSHSGVDSHLTMQVDAAINPGNSGGPVMYKNAAVGVAFQGLMAGENIGYAIPVPVIRHFLDDIEDGHYHGYPELGIGYFPLQNPALRRDVDLPKNASGVAVSYVDPFGSARGLIAEGDVLLEIDGYAIANDGSIRFDGGVVEFMELIERKQWGEDTQFKIWRDGGEISLTVPLRTPFDPFAYRRLYDVVPEYLVFAGLVFAPLNQEFLQAASHGARSQNLQRLHYYSRYAKVDGLYKGRDEFVVVGRRLAHPVNTYAEDYVNALVDRVNDRRIANMHDLRDALAAPANGFHVFEFIDNDERLVVAASAAAEAREQILRTYGIPAAEKLGPPPKGEKEKP